MSSLPIVRQLIELMHWALVTIHGLIPDSLATVSWGLAIILLTIVVRLILFPLTWKQYRSAQSMQAIQPKISELQKKFKSDRAKLQQETMKLYQEHHVNPFASCMPLLLQMPVFISLYYSISGRAAYLDQSITDAISNASFLWIDRLGDPNTVLLVFYVVTQLASTELTLSKMSDPRQKWMMRGMPIIFVFILMNFPAGLFLYWITTNLWTIMQQLIIRRLTPLTVTANGKPPKKSRFMEAITQAQEDRVRQRGETMEASADGTASGDEAGKPAKTRGPSGKPGGKGTGARKGVPAGKSGQARKGAGQGGQSGPQGKKRSGGGKPRSR